MAYTATNVSTGKPGVTGAIYVAPLGTTLPTDATTALASSNFTSLGYVSEDGLSNSASNDSTPIKSWGGATVEITEDNYTDTFTFTLLESLNPDVLEAVNGNVTGETLASGISTVIGAYDRPEQVWVIDMVMRGGVAKRIVIPRGKITAVGEITYRRNQAVGYPVTLTALYDGTIVGTHKEYLKTASTT